MSRPQRVELCSPHIYPCLLASTLQWTMTGYALNTGRPVRPSTRIAGPAHALLCTVIAQASCRAHGRLLSSHDTQCPRIPHVPVRSTWSHLCRLQHTATVMIPISSAQSPSLCLLRENHGCSSGRPSTCLTIHSHVEKAAEDFPAGRTMQVS